MHESAFKIDKEKRDHLRKALQETGKDYGMLLGNYGLVKQSNIMMLNVLNHLMKRNDSVLDIGCGSGFMLYTLSRYYEGYFYGLDKYIFSEYDDEHFASNNIVDLITLCRDRGINILNVDVEKDTFPFEDEIFDISYSKAVIEHFHHSPRHMLNESYRTLKKGGYFILSTPNVTKIEKRLRFLLGRSIMPNYNNYYHFKGFYTGHIREHTMAEAIFALKGVNFKVENICFDINPPSSKNPKNYMIYFLKKMKKSFRDILFLIAKKE